MMKSMPSDEPPHDSWSMRRLRRFPGFDPIRQFIRWFWHVGGLDDVDSPLWRTPFGAWFLVFLSSPLLISALVVFIRSELFLHWSISADGTVIRLAADHDQTVDYAPVFAYTAQDNRTFVVQTKTYSSAPRFRVGQKVPVLYEKDHPERARIATHTQVHSLEEVFGAIGFFFAAPGVGSLIYQRRRKRRARGWMVTQ